MKAIVVRCPECNASLEAGAETREVTCTYCGTRSVVQRRTRFLQRPTPVAPPAPDTPSLPAATQRTSLLSLAFTLLFPLAMAVGLPTVICTVVTGARPVGPMVLGDVNGDGIGDLITQVRTRQSEVNRLTAFDGRNGRRLWRSDELKRGTFMSALCLAGGVVLENDGGPLLRGFGLADGKLRYSVQLGEAMSQLCEGTDAASVGVVTADKRAQLLSLADGRLSSIGGLLECRPLHCDARSWRNGGNMPGREVLEHNDLLLPGMFTDKSLLHRASGTTIAVGHKAPGTQVPMVASIRPAAPGRPRPGDTLLWQAVVPGSDPMAAGGHRLYLEMISLDGQALAVSYEAGDRFHLTVFSSADGKRRFDLVLPELMRQVWSTLLTPRLAIVSSAWGVIAAYDAATGDEVFTID